MQLQLGLCREAPSDQTAADIFRGEWTYRLPLPGLSTGDADGFLSPQWFLELCRTYFGSFRKFSVLELGPLEGEVTYGLERLGPRRIVSIEGRQSSFLKCLIVKELLGWKNVSFMLGDFVKYLQSPGDHYDFCCAQGVLYHMQDPVELLWLIAQRSERVYVGTYYYDEERLFAVSSKEGILGGIANPMWNLPASREEREVSYEGHGVSCVYYKHLYNVREEEQENPTKQHHHGLDMYAVFMRKQDIVEVLEKFGMRVLDVMDHPDSDRGPYVRIIAERRKSRSLRARVLWSGRALHEKVRTFLRSKVNPA